MTEGVLGLLSNPYYLLIVSVGVLGVLRQRARHAVRASEDVAEDVCDEDPQWTQARETVLEALGGLGFQRDAEIDGHSRLLMERPDLAISVSWDVRRRQVTARVAESLQRGAAGMRGPQAVARQNLFTCQIPRSGKADEVIAQFTAQLQARTETLSSREDR